MPDIDKISSRSSEYLAQTGVPQLMSGVVFSLLGSVVLIRHWLPKEFLAQETPQWIANRRRYNCAVRRQDIEATLRFSTRGLRRTSTPA
jgi:hypothetical protein